MTKPTDHALDLVNITDVRKLIAVTMAMSSVNVTVMDTSQIHDVSWVMLRIITKILFLQYTCSKSGIG